MKYTTRLLAVLVASAMLAACSTSNSAPPTPSNPGNPGAPGASVLQFAAGNLTIAGIAGVAGVNVVSTLRGKNGASALLSDTPTITGPFTFGTVFAATAGNAGVPSGANPPGDGYTTAFGATPSSNYLGAPSFLDASLNQMSGTPQTLHLGAPACDTTNASAPAGYTSCAGTGESTPSDTTFGFSGGVFVNGLQPANSTENSKPYSFAPYPLPQFSTTGTAGQVVVPWGGPPAFDDQKNGLGYRDGQHATGLLGAIMGLTAFQLPAGAVASGTFAMSDLIYTGGQSTATLGPITSAVSTAKALPAITAAPTVAFDGSGGLNVTVPAFPTGVTEEIVEIVDSGPVPASVGKAADANCQDDIVSSAPVLGSIGTSYAPVYYTLVFTAAGSYTGGATAPTGGTENVGLADASGPNNNQKGPTTISPTMAVCTAAANSAATGVPGTLGDSITWVTYGLDYDAYGILAPKNMSQTPTIVGGAGEDDMTISAANTSVSP